MFINHNYRKSKPYSIDVYFTKGEIIQDLKLYTNVNTCGQESDTDGK